MDPPYVFTLIHGTFRPKAAWTQPGSKLRDFLEARYPGCVITAPEWSGINTHIGRLKESENIGNCLLDQHQRHPAAKHFVIAHSHGGTIVLHACEDESVRQSLSGVITLGTPFIHSRRRDLRGPIRLFKEIVKLGRNLYLMWLWAITLLFLGVVAFIYEIANVNGRFSSSVGTAVTVVCLVVFIGILFISIKLRLKKSILHAVIAVAFKKVRAKQRRLYVSMREPYRFVRDTRLLAVSVDLDEARMLLRILRGFGGLAHFIHDVLSYAIRPAVYISFLLGFAVLLKRMYLFYAKTPNVVEFLMRSSFGIAKFQLWGFFWIAILSLLLHGLMIVWPIVRLHRYGYGEESFWPNWLLDIHVRKSPGLGPKWSLKKVPSQVKFGRHSFLYNDPVVMKAVAEWIESPELFATVSSPEQTLGKRPSGSMVVRVVSWILLAALAVWLWLDPIQIYHIHS
ncbi:esterase/lipase family protein [Noviherbaspirillum saxi]|uniref:Alpha/beta hydrolase family protein n=1 Tax=Noviherbaspirillum saxi TaxID=2320863 RepID=A0A3A3FKH7_9BURK|nr:hypothetical protein [Noviherbaspirillum saxi]RJF95694.1 hypothetical protein D3871_20150 [Noviherbaspirillum saxi]